MITESLGKASFLMISGARESHILRTPPNQDLGSLFAVEYTSNYFSLVFNFVERGCHILSHFALVFKDRYL